MTDNTMTAFLFGVTLGILLAILWDTKTRPRNVSVLK